MSCSRLGSTTKYVVSILRSGPTSGGSSAIDTSLPPRTDHRERTLEQLAADRVEHQVDGLERVLEPALLASRTSCAPNPRASSMLAADVLPIT